MCCDCFLASAELKAVRYRSHFFLLSLRFLVFLNFKLLESVCGNSVFKVFGTFDRICHLLSMVREHEMLSKSVFNSERVRNHFGLRFNNLPTLCMEKVVQCQLQILWSPPNTVLPKHLVLGVLNELKVGLGWEIVVCLYHTEHMFSFASIEVSDRLQSLHFKRFALKFHHDNLSFF